MKNIFYSSFFVFVPFLLISCTKGTFVKKSFNDVKTEYSFKSRGKSNKDFIDALDIWGAQTFGDWQKVKQATHEERGIFIFRYGESYILGSNVCDILVSVMVKRKDEKTLSVTFSNIVHHLSDCFWINEGGVADLNFKFQELTKKMEWEIGRWTDLKVLRESWKS